MEPLVSTPKRTIKEYSTANVNVIINMLHKNVYDQTENFIEILNHTPIINRAILINTTRVPPKYFPHNSCVRETGLESNRSIFPFSSIIGIKLELAKIARSRPNEASGVIIAISNFDTISASIGAAFLPAKPFTIESRFVTPRITAVKTTTRIEIIE